MTRQWNETVETEEILKWWVEGKGGAREIKLKYNKFAGKKLK